jgi:uncharacterized protein
MSLFEDLSLVNLILLGFFCFLAGFIDAVVGGGGLIQLPSLLVSFPNLALPTLMGTNKIAALSGTLVSAFKYAQKISFERKLIVLAGLTALIFSFLGAKCLHFINPALLKPLILIILIAIAIFTFTKKDLGQTQVLNVANRAKFLKMFLICSLAGFYDGFFGPGTGSFLIIGLVTYLHFDFLKASAYAKAINCFTNLGALSLFIQQGNYMLAVAVIMAVCNIAGNLVGVNLAISKGNTFIRNIFMLVVFLLICRYTYDIFLK